MYYWEITIFSHYLVLQYWRGDLVGLTQLQCGHLQWPSGEASSGTAGMRRRRTVFTYYVSAVIQAQETES